MKSFKQFQEAIALAPLAIPASKLIGAGLVATGLTGMVLQSRKKKEEKEDLLGAVRKKQDEIQQDVANKETLKQNEKHINKDKQKGKHVIRKKRPENEFAGDVINNQGPGLKPGSGTKPGGKWDKLPKGKSSNWSGNNLTGIAKEVNKNQNKIKLKDFIKNKYGNKDQLTGGTLPEEMMGGGAPTNNLGGGQIAGTIEGSNYDKNFSPPVDKKKRKAWNKGKKYMKGPRKQWMV